jgi:hypothetical protein
MALLAGLWAGLERIGWSMPTLEPSLATLHGPLMVDGFLGVVIALERAVALGRTWGYLSPGLSGLGALVLLLGLPTEVGAALFVASSAVLMLIFGSIYGLRREASTLLLLAGAATWLVGNSLWLLGRPIVSLVPWWVGFLVLTIVGERLELAQVMMSGSRRALLVIGSAIVLLGLALSLGLYAEGLQVAGLGLVGLAAWLLRFDVARRSLRRPGLPRFSGVALLIGYVWLAAAGILWLLGPERVGGFWYDAMLHSIFLGFGFSMIFGHAPTILPAISGIRLPFREYFYVHLLLLHASLALRVLGDLTMQPDARRWGGMLNEVAVVLFIGATIIAARAAPTSTRVHDVTRSHEDYARR